MELKRMKVDIRNDREIQPLHQSDDTSLNKVTLWCHKECCTVELLKRRLPIITWLPKYSFADFKGDLISGTTVALTVIPQGLALALLAGLPPQYGLYTAFMGCFVYAIFGSCKNLTIGPTSVMSLMTAQHVTMGGVTYCILITFLAGCIMLLMGLLNLGFLITFISSSVVSGFTTAAAVTIATSQLSGIKNGGVNYWDLLLGVSCVIFLILISYYKNLKFNICCQGRMAESLSTVWRIFATARNALVVILCATIAGILLSQDLSVLTLTQEVETGLPPFRFPEFQYSHYDNATNRTVHKDFIQIVKDMNTAIIVIPLLCVLEAVAIAKSFAKGKKIDATQEMIALGLCNIMGSFVSSYPATGSFSRTAINYNSGVRTPAGGIATGAIVLLALGLMSPYFRYIPKASLSALIIVSVLNMVHYKDIAVMWRTKKIDLIPFFATLIVSFVLGLEYGILIGVGISVCFLLFYQAKPKIFIEERKTFLGSIYLFVKPDRSVFFPSAEYLQTKILKALFDGSPDGIHAVVLDGDHIMNADYTLAVVLKNMIELFEREKMSTIFINWENNVKKIILGVLDSPTSVHFIDQDDFESFIDGMYVDKLPPAYDTESMSEDHSTMREEYNNR